MPSSPSNHDFSDDPQDPRMGDDDSGRVESSSVLIPERFLPELAVPSAGSAGTGSDAAGSALDLGAPTREESSAIARAEVVAQWLQRMERHSAPFPLEGLVVAAMHPGHRQARAAASLGGLTRLGVPGELDVLVARNIYRADPSSSERAPRALDRLVQERVKEPEAGLVKGMAKRLDPVQAPQELQARVEHQLESGVYPKPVRSRRWLRLATAGVALAAGVLMMSRTGQLVPADVGVPSSEAPMEVAAVEVASGDVLTTASGLSFTVTYVDSDTMSAADRNVLRAIGLPSTGGS